MPDPELIAPKEADKGHGIQLPPLPENSNIRIYVDNKERDDRPRRIERLHDEPAYKAPSFSMRAVWAWAAGLVSGAAAAFGANMHVQDQMLEFEREVARKTTDTVTGRGGLGAALADSGASILPGSNLTGLGPGMSSHIIEQRYQLELISKEAEKYKFAKWMRRIGGSGTYVLGAGVAVGSIIGLATYALLPADKKKPAEKTGDWQAKVDNEKEQPRDLG